MAGRDTELFLRLLADEVLDRATAEVGRSQNDSAGHVEFREEFGEFAHVVRAFRVIGEIDADSADQLLADTQLALALRHLPGGVLAARGRGSFAPRAPRAAHSLEAVVGCDLRYELEDRVVTIAWIVRTENTLELAARSVHKLPIPAGERMPLARLRAQVSGGRPLVPLPPRLGGGPQVLPDDLTISDDVGRTYQTSVLASAGSAIEQRALIAIEPRPATDVAYLEFRHGDAARRVSLEPVVPAPGSTGRDETAVTPAERYLRHLAWDSASAGLPGWVLTVNNAFVAAGLVPADTNDLARLVALHSVMDLTDTGYEPLVTRPLGVALRVEDTDVILVGLRSEQRSIEIELYVTPFAPRSTGSWFADPPWFVLEDDNGVRHGGRFSTWGDRTGGGWSTVTFEHLPPDAQHVRFLLETPFDAVYADLEVRGDG